MASAAQAELVHAAYAIASEAHVTEGTATDAVSRAERTTDSAGNPTVIRMLGDLADSTDDVTATISYAQGQDATRPMAVYPSHVTMSGTSGPATTAKVREVWISYDGLANGVVARGNPTRVERAWNGSMRVEESRLFDAYGNLWAASSPYVSGSSDPVTFTTFAYDSTGTFLVTRTEAAFTPEQLATSFDTATACGGPAGTGLVCTITAPGGQQTVFTYDRFGREISRSAPGGYAHVVSYADADRATTARREEAWIRWSVSGAANPDQDASAIHLVRWFDGLGRTTLEQRPGRGSAVDQRGATYDAAGQLARVHEWGTGSSGPATDYEYDALGRAMAQRAPDRTTLLAYAPRETTMTEAAPQPDTNHWRVVRSDGFGRLAQVLEYPAVSGTPAVTRYGYDPFGDLVSVIDPAASSGALDCTGLDAACSTQLHETVISYDALGNRIQLVDPDTGTWDWIPDARGRVMTALDPRTGVGGERIRQVFTYDGLDRILTRSAENVSPAEAPTTFTYGLPGTSPPNDVGRLVSVSDGEGMETFSYDAAGNVELHDRTLAGHRFEFAHAYDPLGRRRQSTYPDGETIVWTFDRRLLVRVTPSGGAYGGDYVADVAYDALDRAVTTRLGASGSTPVLVETRSYDPVTLRLDGILATSGAGATLAELGFTSDGFGRITALDSRTLDPGPPGGLEATRSFGFRYDDLDRLVEASGPFGAGASTSLTLGYGYDRLGNLRRKSSSAAPGELAALSYEDPQRPHGLTHARDAEGFAVRQLAYDGAGNVTTKQTWSGAAYAPSTLAYDSQGRPVHWSGASGSSTLRYDGLGRRVRLVENGKTLLYPEPGYEYQLDEHLVSKLIRLEGRLVASSSREWTAPLAAASHGVLGPDPWGSGLPDAPLLALALGLYGAAALALLLRPGAAGRGASLRRATSLVLAASSPALLASTCEPTGVGAQGIPRHAILFYATDHLGSVLVASGNGTALARTVYRPFGEAAMASGDEMRHRFTGAERDASGLYALGSRSYDPDLGRFLQPDAVVPGGGGDPQGLNRYGYAWHNPLSFSDPSGNTPACRMEGFACGEGGGVRFTPPWQGGGAGLGALAESLSVLAQLDHLFSDPALVRGLGQVFSLFGGGASAWAGGGAVSAPAPPPPAAPAVPMLAPQSGDRVGLAAWSEGRSTAILYSDYAEEVRSGGTWAWRNNNPGNLEVGDFAWSQGAIGSSGPGGRFAVFPDEATGADALTSRLRTRLYKNLTVDQTIATWAPPFENPTASYQQFVRGQLGLPGNAPLSSLSSQQLGTIAGAIRRFEGWQAGTVSRRRVR